jgi:hypothetical protein
MSATHGTYPICATSDDERKDWVKAIRKVMYADKGGGMNILNIFVVFGNSHDLMLQEYLGNPLKKL